MSEKNNGVPAFPVAHDGFYKLGMTLRDYFAGQALASLFGSESAMRITPQECAQECYEQADAMLKERDK